MTAAGRAVPDRGVEGVHQLPRPLRRVGQRVAPRRRRPGAPAGRRRVHRVRRSSSGCRSSPRTRACRRRSGYTSPHASPGRRRARPPRPTPTCASSCTTPGSRPTSPRVRTTTRRGQRRRRTGSSRACSASGDRTEPERVRRARYHLVVADGRPDQAAHLLGKLLKSRRRGQRALGHRLASFYGSPQDQIQAFRAFQITRGVPGAASATPRSPTTIKRKVLGLNALRLHDVDPVDRAVRVHPRRPRAASAARSRPRSQTLSARAPAAELLRFVAHEREASRASDRRQRCGLMPARSPRVTNLSAILRLASSIISSPNITAPRRSPSVVAFS